MAVEFIAGVDLEECWVQSDKGAGAARDGTMVDIKEQVTGIQYDDQAETEDIAALGARNMENNVQRHNPQVTIFMKPAVVSGTNMSDVDLFQKPPRKRTFGIGWKRKGRVRVLTAAVVVNDGEPQTFGRTSLVSYGIANGPGGRIMGGTDLHDTDGGDGTFSGSVADDSTSIYGDYYIDE